jgi:hypothetical protein
MDKTLNLLYGVVTVVVGLLFVPYIVDIDMPSIAHQYPTVHTYLVPAIGLVLGFSFALGLRGLIDRFRKAA